MVSWSYSSMSLFQMCPKKYYHLRVAKDVIEPPSQQMRYGLDVHKAAEEYIRDGVDLPTAFEYMRAPLDKLKAMPGEKLCEHTMGLTADLQPCGFRAKEVWWRGIADLIIINGDEARVVDYKTGKNNYPDSKQLELLALATFKHFPDVKRVKAGLLFVVHPAFVKEQYDTTEQEVRWKKWQTQAQQLQSAYENNVWNAKENFTCRKWCPVVSCPSNGRGEWG